MKNIFLVGMAISIALLIAGCASPALKHSRIGDDYFLQEQWDNAITEYTAALGLEPSDKLASELNYKLALSYANRAETHFQEGNFDAAITDYIQAAKADSKIGIKPKLNDAYKARAALNIESGKYDIALADIEAAIRLNPEDAATHYLRGIAHIGKKMFDVAIVDLSKAIGIDKNIDTDLRLAEAYMGRADILMAQNHKDEAIAYLEKIVAYCNEVIARNPDSSIAYLRLGNAYLSLQKIDLAVSNFDKAIELAPSNSEAYRMRSTAHLFKGNAKAAIADLDKAINLNPNDARSYYQRSLIQLDQGNEDSGIADLNKAIEVGPQYFMYHNRAMYHLGKALPLPSPKEAKPLLELAIADLTKALELKPDLFLSHFWRGWTYYQLDQWDLAESDLKKAIELSNDPEKIKAAESILRDIASKKGQ